MLAFTETPIRSDLHTLSLLVKSNPTLLNVLEEKDLQQLKKAIYLDKTKLTPVKVPVHRKSGVSLETRYVNNNPDDTSNSPPVSSKIEHNKFIPNFNIKDPIAQGTESIMHALKSVSDSNPKYSFLSTFTVKNSNIKDNELQVIFDKKYKDLQVSQRIMLPSLIKKFISEDSSLDNTGKLSLDKDKDGFLTMSIPFKSNVDTNQANEVQDSPYKIFKKKSSCRAFFGGDFDTPTPFGDWGDKLSTKESYAVMAYTNGGDGFARLLNTFLRSQPRNSFNDDTHKWNTYSIDEVRGIAQLGKLLDSAIDKFELPEPIQVHRKVKPKNDNSAGMLEKLIECWKNDTPFVEEGYCSTSPIKGSYFLRNNIINLVINVPAGKGVGAWVCPFSNYYTEQEFLLARGTQFKVLTDMSKFDPNSDNYDPNETTIELEVVQNVQPSWEDMILNRENLIDTDKNRPKVEFDFNKIKTNSTYDEYAKYNYSIDEDGNDDLYMESDLELEKALQKVKINKSV